jgi:hypothetical protein
VFADAVAALAALGALATAAAVFIAFFELRAAKEFTRTSFEDDLSREYRSIIGELPVEAFYANPAQAPLSADVSTRRAFYRYMDLSNEQLFLARIGRVSPATAEQWRDGIRGNLLRLPAFREAWLEIAELVPSDFFEDLREVVPPSAR